MSAICVSCSAVGLRPRRALAVMATVVLVLVLVPMLVPTVASAAQPVPPRIQALPARSWAASAPPGTADPSQMVLQPSDLAPGTKVIHEGAPTLSGFAAGYMRVFGPTTAPDGATLAGIFSEVDVAQSPAEAANAFAQIRLALGRRAGQRELAKALVGSLNGAGAGRLRVRAGAVRVTASAPSVGNAALMISMAVPLQRIIVRSDLIVVREDRAVALLAVTFIGRSDRRHDVTSLAQMVVTHIRSVLVANQGGGPPSTA